MSPVGRTVWEGLGHTALLEMVYHRGVGFEVSKAHIIPNHSFCLMLVDQDLSSQLLVPVPFCLLTVMLPAMKVIDSPCDTESPRKSSFYKLPGHKVLLKQ